VNVSTDPARTVDITEGESVIVDFTYAVKWRETAVPFERRMDKYSRYSFLPQHLEARPFPVLLVASAACGSSAAAPTGGAGGRQRAGHGGPMRLCSRPGCPRCRRAAVAARQARRQLERMSRVPAC
jgi:hypothetical protein